MFLSFCLCLRYLSVHYHRLPSNDGANVTKLLESWTREEKKLSIESSGMIIGIKTILPLALTGMIESSKIETKSIDSH